MMLKRDLEGLHAWLAGARVLVVDDEPANLTFLRHVLEPEGYGELITMNDSVEALDRLQELSPDVVVVDLWMPALDGFEFITRMLDQLPPDTYLPALVTTGDHTPEARRRALSVGARDFLTKPLSPAEVRLRVRNLLETRFLHVQLRHHNTQLEERVGERTHELEEARLEILHRLARAAEFRDDQSGQHTLRVGRLSGRIAQVLGLPRETCELIVRAAPLHDIGKIGVPDSVLLKPGRLDPQERGVIESHTAIGAEILSGSRYPLLQLAEEIALNHHERWDGTGYPRRLAGDRIPISGRIVAAADVFDALTHERPYKRAWTARDALAEIEAHAGTQFDPAVVEALLRVAPEADAIAGLLRGDVPADTAPSAPGDRVPSIVRARPVDVNAMVALRRLQEERDALMREVGQLRRQLALHETGVVGVDPWAQPN
jgi:putative two-component system response regulator